MSTPAAPVVVPINPVTPPVTPPAQSKVAIAFSSARVRQVLDGSGLNQDVNLALKPHKAIVARYKACNEAVTAGTVSIKVTHDEAGNLLEKPLKKERVLTTEEIAAHKKELDELHPASDPNVPRTGQTKYEAAREMVTVLGSLKIRIANVAPPTLGVICGEVVKELLQGAVGVIKATTYKIVYPKHVFQSQAPTKYHKLYASLEVFASKKALFEAEQLAKRTQKDLTAAVIMAKKEWAKIHRIQPEGKKDAAKKSKIERADKIERAEKVDRVEGEKAAESTPGVSFKVYVARIINDIKKEEGNSNICFSEDVRNLMSELITEFIHAIATRVHIDVLSRKNKTITPTVIMRAVEYLLVEGFEPKSDLELGTETIPDPSQVKTGMTAEQLAALPKITRRTAKKTTVYPRSHYQELRCDVHATLIAAGHEQKMIGFSS